MAAPIKLDLTGFAGVSTHAQDLRTQNAGKRVTGFLAAKERYGNVCLGFSSSHEVSEHQTETTNVAETHSRNAALTQLDHIGLGFSQLLSEPQPIKPAKPIKKRYATDQDYKKAFDTRWRADAQGRMALYLSRKPGHATIETNPDKLDMITTFHRERGSVGAPYKPDNICNDKFLTGSPTAATMDVIKSPRNRAPPSDNAEGPFSRPLTGLHPSKIDHLDRTCNPRPEAPRAAIDIAGDTGGKGRVRVFREQSHIYSQGGFLIGDNRLPRTVETRNDVTAPAARNASATKSQCHGNGRALVSAPWTQESLAAL